MIGFLSGWKNNTSWKRGAIFSLVFLACLIIGIVLHEYSHWIAGTLRGYSANVNLSLNQSSYFVASIISTFDRIVVALAGGVGVFIVFSLLSKVLSDPKISVPLQFIAMLNGAYALFEVFYTLNWMSAWQAQMIGNLVGITCFAFFLFCGRDSKVIDLLRYIKLGHELG